jgi:hypothetical protein
VGKRLDSVLLEFAVDASPMILEDSTVVVPVVGAFPLTATYTGGGVGNGRDSAPVFNSAVPSARPIATGENRLVRMDVTDIVKGWMANPSSNHGLVIGSLTGPEAGAVTMRGALPGSESAVRLTFFYQNRFGGRVSSTE